MPSFSYLAMDKDGKRTRGVCESSDLQAAAATLRAGQMFVLEIRPLSAQSMEGVKRWARRAASGFLGRIGRPVTGQDRIQFLRQMCLMLRAGLPLLHALEVFADQCPKPLLAKAVRRVATRIQHGGSFSTALAQEPSLLSPLTLKMVAVGETIGELDTIMERMADHFERRAEFRSSILTSLAYPVLLLLITIAVVVFLVTQVIPKFLHLLAGRNVAMPAITQHLVKATEFLNANGLKLAIGIVLGAILIAALSLLGKVRYWMDRCLLAVPLLGSILTLAFVAHFGRTLAILLKSGVPILDGLRVLGNSIGNKAFALRIQDAAANVLAGKPLSQGLRASIIPPLLPELVSVGEISGTLDGVLADAAVFYETKLRRKVKLMASLFEPTLILVVGGIVGFVYIAFFSVLYQVSSR